MKREMLFSGERLDNGELTEGYFFSVDGRCFILNFIQEKDDVYHNIYEVNKNTICQTMDQAFEALKRIDAAEFMKQKSWLYRQIKELPPERSSAEPEKILNLMDHIQDICEEAFQMEFPEVDNKMDAQTKRESSHTEIGENDSIGYADLLKIIFGQHCITHCVDDERLLKVTFADVLEIAKTNGYKNGVITLIAESPLNGRVYLYGNFGPFWVECSSTNGYA